MYLYTKLHPVKPFNEASEEISSALALHLGYGFFYLPEEQKHINFKISYNVDIPKWELKTFNIWCVQNLLLSAEEVNNETLSLELYNQHLQKQFCFTDDDFSENSAGRITTHQKIRIFRSWLHYSFFFVIVMLGIWFLLIILSPPIFLATIILVASTALLIPIIRHAKTFKSNNLLMYEGQAVLKSRRDQSPLVKIKEEPRELPVYLYMKHDNQLYPGTYRFFYVKHLYLPISVKYISRVRKRPKKKD